MWLIAKIICQFQPQLHIQVGAASNELNQTRLSRRCSYHTKQVKFVEILDSATHLDKIWFKRLAVRDRKSVV